MEHEFARLLRELHLCECEYTQVSLHNKLAAMQFRMTDAEIAAGRALFQQWLEQFVAAVPAGW